MIRLIQGAPVCYDPVCPALDIEIFEFHFEYGFHCETGPVLKMKGQPPEWYIRGAQISQEEFERRLKLKAFW